MKYLLPSRSFQASVFILALFLIFGYTATATADGTVKLSKNSDFSTSDRSFHVGDTLYIKVNTDNIDPLEIEENEFELEPNGSGESLEGELNNNLDGTFTARIPLSGLEGSTQSWNLSISIEDDDDHSTSFQSDIVVNGLTAEKEFVTVTGTVNSTGSGSLTVGGEKFVVTDSTEISAADGSSITLSDIQAGDRIRLTAFEHNDESVAVTIRKVGVGFARLKIEGRVSRVFSDSVEVCGFMLATDANTELRGEERQNFSLADLDSTMSVEVRAVTSAEGWLISELRVKEMEEESSGSEEDSTDSEENFAVTNSDVEETECEFEINGSVSAVNADSGYVAIGGLTLRTTDDTEFEGGLSGISGLKDSARVKIDFARNSNGQFVINEIQPREEQEKDFEFEGAIQQISDNSIRINNISITITDQTQIFLDDEQVATSELYSGLVVSVEAVQQADGTLEARIIEVDDDLNQEVEVKGEILAINADSTINLQDNRIRVTADTRIVGDDGQSLAFGDLQTGQFAEVEATRSLDTLAVADNIEIENRFGGDRIETEGTITSTTGSSLTLKNGRTFAVNSSTEIKGEEEESLTLDSLQTGDFVEVKGVKQSDGSLLALEIERDESNGDTKALGTLKGFVQSVGNDSLVVSGVVFQYSAEFTVFEEIESADQLQQGDFVVIHFRRTAEGDRVARSIEFKSKEQESIEVEGSIDSLSTNAVIVAGARIQVSDTTVIESDSTLSFSDLTVGTTVEVEARAGTNNSLIADRISIEEINIVASTIDSTSSSTSTITVAGQTVQVDDGTLILDQNGNSLSPDQLETGMFVQVVSVTSSGTKLKAVSNASARQVEVLGSSSTETPIENKEADLPSGFTLHHNYPNPFNPTTTLRYELQQSARVTLTIYNVLGQQVTQLVDRKLQAGSHKITWNAANMASGTYFARMEVEVAGKVVSRQIEKMLLLK